MSILVDRNAAGKPEFIIQHRAIEMGVGPLPATDYPMSLVSDICIDYCPWCGRKLDRWYSKYVDDLLRLGLKISSV
jgi:hypothetical protein